MRHSATGDRLQGDRPVRHHPRPACRAPGVAATIAAPVTPERRHRPVARRLKPEALYLGSRSTREPMTKHTLGLTWPCWLAWPRQARRVPRRRARPHTGRRRRPSQAQAHGGILSSIEIGRWAPGRRRRARDVGRPVGGSSRSQAAEGDREGPDARTSAREQKQQEQQARLELVSCVECRSRANQRDGPAGSVSARTQHR